MNYLRYRSRRLFGKALAIAVVICCFGLGISFGYYYETPGASKISFGTAFKTILFYGGDVSRCPGYLASLPKFSDIETDNGSSLGAWEVTYYHDEKTDTDVPVFYGETISDGGVKAAMGTALLRVSDAREVPLEAVEPEKISVLIYCTHTAESYDGKADEDGRGQVLAAAHHLADTLTSVYHIGAVVSDTVHDSPDWYRSYTNSKATAAEMMSQYPDADLIIDFHRDSGLKKADCTVGVDGRDAASLLLVVGSDQTLAHPNWEKNWETAKAVGACIDEVNPALLRGIRVQKGRYNQHLSEKCILLEVGTELNTLAEAEYSTELVAEAIAKYLQ